MPTEDDDIWDYKPTKRGKKAKEGETSCSSIIAYRKGKPETNPIKLKSSSHGSMQNRLKSKCESQVGSVPEEKVVLMDLQVGNTEANQCITHIKDVTEDGVGAAKFCPFCQMPFIVLRVQSPRLHVMECMDLPISTTQECNAGLKCDDTTSGHYRKYRHTLLADLRSGVLGNDLFEQEGRNSNDESHQVVDHAKRKLNFSSTKKTMEMMSSKETCSDNVSENHSEQIFSREPPPTFDSDVDQAKKKLSFSVRKCDKPATQTKCDNAEQTTDDSTVCVYDIFPDSSLNCDSEIEYTNTRKRKLERPSIKETVTAVDNTPFTKVKPFMSSVTPESSTNNEVPTKRSMKLNHKELTECSAETETHDNSCNSDRDIFENDMFGDDDDDFFSNLEMHQNLVISNDVSKQTQSDSNQSFNQSRIASERFNGGDDLLSTPSKFGMVLDTNDTLVVSQRVTSTNKSSYSNSLSQVNTQRGSAQKKSKSLQLQRDASQTSISSFFKLKVNTKGNSKAAPAQASVTSNPVSNASSTKRAQIIETSGLPALARAKTIDSQPQPQEPNKLPDKPYTLRQAGSSKAKYKGAGEGPVFGDDPEPTASTSGGFKRKCPFYKKMPGTPFTVDAFRYGTIPGCSAYFLTHFHYDHYGGLRKSFAQPIYCTKETANLVEKKIKVDRRYLNSIPLNTPTVIHGVEVTFMDANHCPGSVIMLFKLADGRVYLHTGDFRATPAMQQYPQLRGLHVNQVYLDTTYCDPSYAFPPQDDVIRFAVNTTTDFLHDHPNGLIAVGSYTIGKERIFMGIAEALNCKVCVAREKKNTLECLEDDVINRRITLTAMDARVHVVAMKDLNHQALSSLLNKVKTRFDAILAFEPTGWTHSSRLPSVDNIKPKWRRDNITLYGIPYSEHSSYTEMKEFCQFLKADKILPTVNNGNPQTRKKMEALFQSWMTESPSKQMKQQKLASFFASK